MSAEKYSLERFTNFCDYLIDKNLISESTGRSRKMSSLKLLELLDPSDKLDLRAIDRDLLFHRFVNMNGTHYTPSSMGVYQSRLHASLDDFIRYTDDPSGYRPGSLKVGSKTAGVKQDTKSVKVSKPGAKQKIKNPPVEQILRPDDAAEKLVSSAPDSLTIPIPLRPGVIVKVFGIPHDLSVEEANKIATIVSGYALTTMKI
jgi:hypothetical protein